MPKDTQAEVLTPGKNEKHYLARDFRTGVVYDCFGERKASVLFRHWLDRLQAYHPAQRLGPDLCRSRSLQNSQSTSIPAVVGGSSALRVTMATDIGQHLNHNGAWPYQLSAFYQKSEVTVI